ncbi:MAG: anthranilate phosphoribosyltransferase [Alphaproteobacteria bacterium]|nr:anthranilate phosphoribosyltransferase [Alphaproteobacteria bacterium]
MTGLTAEQMEAEISAMLKGEREHADIAYFLTSLADKGETVEEITGAARALRKHVSGIFAPATAIDCCGTGGDGRHTLNVSTAVAFVVAACGIPVAKHGNRASSSKCGAADVLEALNVPLDTSLDKLEDALRKTNFCFLMAPLHHRAMANVAPVRKALGRRTVFNLLGPLANPANVKRQMVGVFAQSWVTPMAEALKALGSKGAWVVHGDGMDEISLSGPTAVAMLDAAGNIANMTLTHADFGLPKAKSEELTGGDARFNADALMDLLEGGPGTYRDTVLANAAGALCMAGAAPSLRDGVAMAAAAIDEGRAKNILFSYRDMVA